MGFGRVRLEMRYRIPTPGIAQAGLVLEAYLKVTFVIRMMRRRYQLIQGQFLVLWDNSLYYVVDSRSVQHLYVVRVDEYEFYDRKG